MLPDEEVRITLRMPANLRDRLNEAGAASRRSLNAEIVARLEGSFGNLPTPADLAAFVHNEIGTVDWASPILAELERPQPDVALVIRFLDLMGVSVPPLPRIRPSEKPATKGVHSERP